jgi:hypothetical protein
MWMQFLLVRYIFETLNGFRLHLVLVSALKCVEVILFRIISARSCFYSTWSLYCSSNTADHIDIGAKQKYNLDFIALPCLGKATFELVLVSVNRFHVLCARIPSRTSPHHLPPFVCLVSGVQILCPRKIQYKFSFDFNSEIDSPLFFPPWAGGQRIAFQGKFELCFRTTGGFYRDSRQPVGRFWCVSLWLLRLHLPSLNLLLYCDMRAQGQNCGNSRDGLETSRDSWLHWRQRQAGVFRTFIRIYSLFKSGHLSARIKLTLHKALDEISSDLCLSRLGISGRHQPFLPVQTCLIPL